MGRDNSGDLGVNDLIVCMGVDQIQLAEHRIHWWTLVIVIMNLLVLQKTQNFLTR